MPPQTVQQRRPRRQAARDASEESSASEDFAEQSDSPEDVSDAESTQFYDPNQPIEERRKVRGDLRDLSRAIHDNRNEYLQVGSGGLQKAVEKSNTLFNSVKQTSDATIDSRLLVDAAELSHRKAVQLTLGNAASGIDVNDFVSKCIAYMRSSPDSAGGHGDDEDDPTAVQLDWTHLGRTACRPFNVRPFLPTFLLGPLSVQKRARPPTQRTTQTQRRGNTEQTRPETLKGGDLDKTGKDGSVTVQANKIRIHLQQSRSGLRERFKAAARREGDMSAQQRRRLQAAHGLAGNDEVSFWQYVVNPNSFGQTVENLFYVSFLIREGSVAVGEDRDGIPTLSPSEPHDPSVQRQGDMSKHQAIFSLDFAAWEEIKATFEIVEPMIPDRSQEETRSAVGSRGWY